MEKPSSSLPTCPGPSNRCIIIAARVNGPTPINCPSLLVWRLHIEKKLETTLAVTKQPSAELSKPLKKASE